MLSRAIPSLEQQSFSWKNPPESSFNGSSSDLIATHYLSLVKDIERLNDLCTIARNLLATTKRAQNLAAEKAFDQQILKLIDVCVRVTARGFDGESNARNEERWQKVVNLYKRLLITCLQFLHNFIMHNEHRKLVLWLDLFGNSQNAEGDVQEVKEPSSEEEISQAAREARIKATVEKLPHGDQLTAEGGLGYNIDDVHALFDLMSTNKEPDDHTQEAAKLLMDRIRNDMERLSGLSANQLDDNPEALLKVGAALRAQLPVKDFPLSQALQQLPEQEKSAKAVVNIDRTNAASSGQNEWNSLPDLSSYSDVSGANQEITDEDLTMPRTSQSAAETLQEAKDELMARLQDTAAIGDEPGVHSYSEVGGEVTLDDDIIDSVEDSLEDEDEEEDDEDYRSPGDQERGLLTDVPLVLGPTEIEALPMIIQAGIVDNFGTKNNDRQGVRNMQAVRCHILLAQEAGRNVLRELLIFIAAWDLPDDEFYFKMMVQIMEAILKNGLMSHAYSDFGQAKDIISPAQAVVIKILTHIFRSKYSPTSVVQNANDQTPPKPRKPSPLTRVDVLTVRYIFTVFRGNIIPETCALIYLQGQIRAGLALAEDFPLNLWDMERVYEGVYQFLEFFAVLTENNDWKKLLVEWEIVYDLVTLIKELDASIPKANLTRSMPAANNPASAESKASAPSTSTESQSAPTPVAVERPFETNTDSSMVKESQPSPSAPSPPPPVATEEPADFEWRNLKKLIVLVLSSLVWKSPTVQNQIRQHGGVEVILSCTQHDQNNPYIKEHAVMCLKFLLEGNKENQALVGNLEAREVVGDQQVLQEMGIEITLDETGKVKVVKNAREGGSSKTSTRTTSDTTSKDRLVRMNANGARQQEPGKIIGEELDDI